MGFFTAGLAVAKPTTSPAKRVGVGEEERRSGAAFFCSCKKKCPKNTLRERAFYKAALSLRTLSHYNCNNRTL